MKITIVQGPFLPVPPLLGGAVEKIWFELGKYFAACGHKVTHISRAFSSLPEKETVENVDYIRIPSFDAPHNQILMRLFEAAYCFRVLKKVPESDITITHSILLPFLMRKKKYGKVCVHFARQPKGQTLLYSHIPRFHAISKDLARNICKESPESQKKVAIIPYFVPDKFMATDVPDRHQKPYSAIYVGRIHPEKGLELLIKSWQSLPEYLTKEWQLKIIGPWSEREGGGGDRYYDYLKGLTAGNTKIIFTGPMFDEDQLQTEYLAARIFLYPSLAEKGETFGLSVLEAMARGCIPVISALACFSDFVQDNKSGLIFNHRVARPELELTGKLSNLLESHEVQIRLGINALVQAKQFTLKKVGSMYLQDFLNLLKQP